MSRFFRALFLTLFAASLLAGSAVLANEAPPTAAPTLRTLGFCLVPTDDYKEFCHNKSLNLLRGAAIQKIAGKYALNNTATDVDFVNFINNQEISTDQGLLRELKLPILLDYGTKHNLDFLLVLLPKAKLQKEEHHNYNNGYYSHYTEVSAQITLRAALVDVKKREYVFNLTFKELSNEQGLFDFSDATEFAIHSGTKKVVEDFNQQTFFP